MGVTVASGCSWCIHVVEYKNCLKFSLLFHYFMDILELHVLDLIKWVVLVLLMDPLVSFTYFSHGCLHMYALETDIL